MVSIHFTKLMKIAYNGYNEINKQIEFLKKSTDASVTQNLYQHVMNSSPWIYYAKILILELLKLVHCLKMVSATDQAILEVLSILSLRWQCSQNMG